MDDRTKPPPPQPSNSNASMFYYGLAIVVTAMALLVYNLIIVKWCANSSRGNSDRIPVTLYPMMSRNIGALPSFKYKKEAANEEGGIGNECAVCLSVFEQEEDIKQLPRCKHSFHAPCIDMWLFSHFDCPLCRAPLHQQIRDVSPNRTIQQQVSREGLLYSGV